AGTTRSTTSRRSSSPIASGPSRRSCCSIRLSRSVVGRPLLVAAAALALAGTARAQRPVPDGRAGSDTLSPDSAFRRAGPVLRWQVISRELIGRALAAREGRPARPTFYDGNNNTRLYALVSGAQHDALR